MFHLIFGKKICVWRYFYFEICTRLSMKELGFMNEDYGIERYV